MRGRLSRLALRANSLLFGAGHVVIMTRPSAVEFKRLLAQPLENGITADTPDISVQEWPFRATYPGCAEAFRP
jgi:hypothetical protein